MAAAPAAGTDHQFHQVPLAAGLLLQQPGVPPVEGVEAGAAVPFFLKVTPFPQGFDARLVQPLRLPLLRRVRMEALAEGACQFGLRWAPRHGGRKSQGRHFLRPVPVGPGRSGLGKAISRSGRPSRLRRWVDLG